MPVGLAGRYVDHIAHHQLPWCFAFATNESCPHRNGQDLAAFMSVPKSPRARREADIVAHAIICCEDGIHVYSACESLRGLLGSRVRFVSGADQLHCEICLYCNILLIW